LLTNYTQAFPPVNKNVSYAKLFTIVKTPSSPDEKLDHVADRMHSAAIHLLRHAARQDILSGQGPARLSALSVLVFGGPKTLGELAAAERVKPPTMSRIVAGLKRSGLVRSHSDGQDQRRVRINVTAKGEHLLQEARKRRIQALAEIFGALEHGQLEIVGQAAEMIEQALRRL
jgi:DNA-binding MarR family transcriptional regulator